MIVSNFVGNFDQPFVFLFFFFVFQRSIKQWNTRVETKHVWQLSRLFFLWVNMFLVLAFQFLAQFIPHMDKASCLIYLFILLSMFHDFASHQYSLNIKTFTTRFWPPVFGQPTESQHCSQCPWALRKNPIPTTRACIIKC